MKTISFFMTTAQFLDGSKDVTRRIGWWKLKPGDRLMAVEKGQGLKKGEKMKQLGVIEVVSVSHEPLANIAHRPNDCKREGFPEMSPGTFIRFFCDNIPRIKATATKASGPCQPDTIVNRIEFKRVA